MEAIIEQSRVFYFDWELDLLHWFQSIHNDVLDWLVPKITSLGNAGWFWIVVTLLFLILPYNRKIFQQHQQQPIREREGHLCGRCGFYGHQEMSGGLC